METIVDIKIANALLSQSINSKVSVLGFKATLKKFHLLIEDMTNPDEKLVVIVLGSIHFNGLLTFTSGHLKVEKVTDNFEKKFKIYDENNNLNILFDGGFTLLRFSKNEFVETIDNILK